MPNACRSHEEFTAQTIVLTEHGRAVLEGRVDYRDHQPIDRWLGGVHLQGQGRWRWDLAQRRIVFNTTE